MRIRESGLNWPPTSKARTGTLAGMSDPQQEIADLEAEIEALACAAERCRKVIALSKVATGAGGLMLVVILTGLIRVGPAALVLAITSGLGGLAVFGSHTSTRE